MRLAITWPRAVQLALHAAPCGVQRASRSARPGSGGAALVANRVESVVQTSSSCAGPGALGASPPRQPGRPQPFPQARSQPH